MRYLYFRKDDGDIGAIGIGAMIVFIAMILVAGIAASVLITTSNTVQIQAMQTGQETTREVASGISVFEIAGQVNYTNQTFYDLYRLAITVKARPGSEDIDLNNTYVLISDGSTKALVRYSYENRSVTFDSSISGNLFSSLTNEGWNQTDKERFGIGVLQDYDGSITSTTPVLNRGDKAVLFLRAGDVANASMQAGIFGSEIAERKDIFGRVIPEVGSPGVISFTSPMSYVDQIYKLQ